MKALGKAIAASPSLKSIYLREINDGDAKFGSKGCTAIAEGIRVSRSLTQVLDLPIQHFAVLEFITRCSHLDVEMTVR